MFNNLHFGNSCRVGSCQILKLVMILIGEPFTSMSVTEKNSCLWHTLICKARKVKDSKLFKDRPLQKSNLVNEMQFLFSPMFICFLFFCPWKKCILSKCWLFVLASYFSFLPSFNLLYYKAAPYTFNHFLQTSDRVLLVSHWINYLSRTSVTVFISCSN